MKLGNNVHHQNVFLDFDNSPYRHKLLPFIHENMTSINDVQSLNQVILLRLEKTWSHC